MDLKNEKPQKNLTQFKFLNWIGGPIIVLIFSLGTTILWFLTGYTLPIFYNFIWFVSTFMFLILPWCLTLWMIKTFWTVVTLDEAGVRRALFGVLFKRKILWADLYEMRIKAIPTGGGWLFFSTKSLEGMSLGKMRTRKFQIQVAFSMNLLKAIRQFTDKEIINLPDDILIN